MSLTVAFHLAQRGLAQAEQKMAVVSANISNADKAGYTRKIYQSSYTTANGVTIPQGGVTVQAYVNASLSKTMAAQATQAAKQEMLADYLARYSDGYGGTSESSATLAGGVDDLLAALQAVDDNPGDATTASGLVASAQMLAAQVNALANNVQAMREEASDAIEAGIASVNTQLQAIAELNDAIGRSAAQGMSTADLEDQRMLALQTLSRQIGVQYSITGENRMQVYSAGGDILVGARAATLSYTAPGHIGSGTAYPGSIPGILLNGADITGRIGSGALGALVALRDDILPAEQEKLDIFAAALADTVNTELADGASLPAPAALEGSRGLNMADALGGSGSWRIAVTDSDGTVQSLADLDLSACATVGDLLAALNGIAGVNAALTAEGTLRIASSDSRYGIALQPMDSTIGGRSANSYFGFNALFTGGSASTLGVNNTHIADPAQLAIGRLSDSATLAVGERALTAADTRTLESLLDALQTPRDFPEAGNFAARSTTLGGYAAALVSDAAMQASNAQATADTAAAAYRYLSEKLANETGVNIDEETANMTQIQASYEASAQLVATIRAMFNTLLEAVQ